MKSGDKVRCIQSFPDEYCPRKPEIRPIVGKIYTVDIVCVGVNKGYVFLKEIPKTQKLSVESWDITAFVKVSEPKTKNPDKTEPKYLDWAELILETYCNNNE